MLSVLCHLLVCVWSKVPSVEVEAKNETQVELIVVLQQVEVEVE